MSNSRLYATVGVALFGFASSWSCNDAGASEQLTKVPLGNVDKLAVCNDGTEAAYYFKDNKNTSMWLVYLAGGGWCYDTESCTARSNGSDYPHHDCANSSEKKPCFLSSKDYTGICGKTGVFDTNPAVTPLHAANKIYVPYCTSDGFMGDGEYDSWQFRGARVVRAVIRDLISRGLSEGSTLVFGGGSAGGRGAMVLLDEVARTLPGVVVLGFLDSPYYLDIPSYSANFNGFPMQHIHVLSHFNATSVVSDACGAAYPGTEAWKCLFGVYRMPFVRTPYMLVAAQFDAWQLSHLVHGYAGIEADPVLTKRELTYVESFGLRTTALLETLPSAMTVRSVVYSTACWNHHVSETAKFWTITTSNGTSENDALRMFLNGGRGRLADAYGGYNSGTGCGSRVAQTVVRDYFLL